jgi:SAM-dependent methyltransferase
MTTSGVRMIGETESTREDPFATRPPDTAPAHARLLTYTGRWGRARRWLPPTAYRVLDVGCSYGYGSAALLAGPPAGRTVVGVERDPEAVAAAQHEYPWLAILWGDAGALPVPDGCADALLLLDVIEHLADPAEAIAEARRTLRPGGTLVLSVPRRGPLSGLDALNAYDRLRRRRPSWPPLEPATGSASGVHRHFTRGEIEALLTPGFHVDRIARTGLGLAEIVYFLSLVARVPSGRERVPQPAQLAHLLVYLLDDAVPWGPLGYTLTVRAVRLGAAS